MEMEGKRSVILLLVLGAVLVLGTLLPQAQAEAAADPGDDDDDDHRKVCCHDKEASYCFSFCTHGSSTPKLSTWCADNCCCVLTMDSTCPPRCTSSSLTFTNHAAVPSGLLPPAQAEAAATGGDRKKICCHDEDESLCLSGCLEQHGSGDAARTSCARDCCCVFTWSATCPRRCKSSNLLLTNTVIVDGSEETRGGAA
ncbi:keratin-associated protein 9-4-like [Triticum dicoccoides]|uniref:keratin-associated protein 9-4-like n=1 Tax=Triticum dicoccoides TaxID=85692 RepID=UPI000E78B7E5|nr:keratin-associated protein 9-4-like [Triticum dicoccoides]